VIVNMHGRTTIKINEDIPTKFEQEYVRCVRNEEECVCSAPDCCNNLISGKIIKEMPGSVASGTHCISLHRCPLGVTLGPSYSGRDIG
jgi:hypothetical protein